MDNLITRATISSGVMLSLLFAAWLLYSRTGSLLGAGVAVLYLLLRDSIGGQSLGKLLVGLVVVNVRTGGLCEDKVSGVRNRDSGLCQERGTRR